MALDDLLGGGKPGPGGKPKLNRRTILIAGAGAALVLIFLLSRRGQPATQPAATSDQAAADQAPSTFADNGEQAAALGTATTDALAGVSSSLDQFAAGFQTLSDQLAPTNEAPANGTPPIAITIAPGPAGQVSQPGAKKQPAARAQVNHNKGNPRQGQTYTTKPHPGGGTEHRYPGGKVVVVGAPKKKKK